VLHAATSDGLVGQNYGPVIGAITLLLRACEDAGTIPVRPQRSTSSWTVFVAAHPTRRRVAVSDAPIRTGPARTITCAERGV
jgi:hypothetical protein